MVTLKDVKEAPESRQKQMLKKRSALLNRRLKKIKAKLRKVG